MTNHWIPNGNRVATMAPGPGDLFVVTTLGGKRVLVDPIADYEKALRIAEAFARQMAQPRPLTIKVIPMSLPEMLAHIGTTPKRLAAGLSPDDEASDRQLVVDTCMSALRECNEPQVRKDAYDLLVSIGVMKP